MIYTNPQLREFERGLAPYRQGKYGAVNVNAYLVDKGIGIQDGQYFAIKETQLKAYDEFYLKLQLLSDLQAKTAKAKMHEAEDLAKLQ